MRFAASHAPNQIHPRSDVAPLIAAAHLQRATESIVQHEIVVRLQQRVAELGERDSVFALGAALDRLLCQHRVHGEMLPDVTHEFDRTELGEPVRVVHEPRRIGCDVEVEKPRQLRPDAFDVLLDAIERQQLPLRGLATRIADETGAAAHERDRRVPLTLHVRERHHHEQRPDMETRRGGIESDVADDALARQYLAYSPRWRRTRVRAISTRHTGSWDSIYRLRSLILSPSSPVVRRP